MRITGPIDEPLLRKEFGLDAYDKGMSITQNDGVSPRKEIYPSIHICSVRDGDSEHIVLLRDHTDGKIVLDCDCGKEKCSHMVAALISFTGMKPSEDCDSDVVEEIEDMIANLVEDITSDPNYDEDANYYEDWEIRKYNLENNNDDVEYEHVSEILERILNEIGDPDTAVLLIDSLLEEASELEFNNGGIDSAVSKHSSDISTLFTHISPETIATVLENTSYIARDYYKQFLKHVPKENMDEAYLYLDNGSSQSDIALEMHFEKRDFDSFINCSRLKRDAILRVVKFLDKEDKESAKRYAGMLVDYACGSYDNTVAEVLSKHGFKEEAAEIYKTAFKSSHRQSDFENMRRNSKSIDAGAVLNELASDTFSRDTYDIPALSVLINNGKAKDAAKYILKVGFVPEYKYREYRCEGAQELCEDLVTKGFPEAAAIVGRGLIELRLKLRDSDSYYDAVNMLRFMDSRSEFEELKKPHSEYIKELKDEYPKMRKFWGLYNGTWKDKDTFSRGIWTQW